MTKNHSAIDLNRRIWLKPPQLRALARNKEPGWAQDWLTAAADQGRDVWVGDWYSDTINVVVNGTNPTLFAYMAGALCPMLGLTPEEAAAFGWS